MNITFVTESHASRVRTTATGKVNFSDAVAHLKALQAAGVLGYAEVFDARDVVLDFNIRELQALAKEVRLAYCRAEPGPIAFITNSAFVKGLALTYAALSKEQNPHFQIFTNLDEALEWLETVEQENEFSVRTLESASAA